MKLTSLAAVILVSASITAAPSTQAAKPISLTDIMHFESLKRPVIADNGITLAVEAAPDRGDSKVIVKLLNSKKTFDIKDAAKPKVSADGRFVAMVKSVPLLDSEKASKKEKKKLKTGLILLDTQTGEQSTFEKVKSFAFNKTGSHLVIQFDSPVKQGKKADKSDKEKAKSDIKVDQFDKGFPVRLISLSNKSEKNFKQVTNYHFSENGAEFVVAENDIKSASHQLSFIDLSTDKSNEIFSSDTMQIGETAVANNGEWLAYTTGLAEDTPYGREYHLNLFDLKTQRASKIANSNEWKLNRYSKLNFSKNSEQLLFGRVPEVSQQLSVPKVKDTNDLYSEDVITGQKNLRVWNGEDPLIKPNEVKQYKKELKRTYLASLNLESQNVIQLADLNVPEVTVTDSSDIAIGQSNLPYRKMITWAGFYRDVYLVNKSTGKKSRVLTQYPTYWKPSLSPNGQYMAYYRQGQIYLYDAANKARKNVTEKLGVGFANEDHDYPSAAPGYGFGPWVKGENSVLVYDKYDVWKLDAESGKMTNLTKGQGRKHGVQYRVTGLPKKDEAVQLAANEPVLLKGYNERTKSDDFYRLNLAGGVKQLTSEPVKIKVLARAKDANTLVYSKERYDLFPDLYTSNYLEPQQATQQTFLNKQTKAFDWGQAELVHWTNGDGKPLDGVLIKPANYKQGQRLPVLVYYYRFMSQRLHAFPQMKINHRPNFEWYVENGYAVFLPDIRFEVGYPGPSSVQALVSGVQHLINLGIADPKAIGIQGHSWSGYQTAYAVTQTNIFKAAVAGAPVSNMTSAYSGIRHGSGLARQFQYETGQSRIGESLFDAPQKYIENSPVFYAERIHTPMMIMFGDRDDAVPWEQGIELYLAMRRAGKDVVFLQYQDEPHHLKKYPNKLDYTIKMKQYFDHYLKGAPAPKWLTKGEAYYEYKKD
ncbi:S9 family peptidase [Shewanella sp. OPT22]|nr:S9 family peptidase [Shewanella sp. OPT22]